MARWREATRRDPIGIGVADEGELDTASPLPIALGDDLVGAVRDVATARRRLVVRDGEEELAAIIPIADLRLLLRLEEAELDRIDLEAARRALADPDNRPTVPWEQVQREARP